MRVFVMCEPGEWWDRTRSILTEAGWQAARGSSADQLIEDPAAALVHVVAADPLPLVAPLWHARSELPVLMLGDNIADDVRLAAIEAGVHYVGCANPSRAELVTAVNRACDESRVGSPELVRAICRTMCSLSSALATAEDPSFLAVAVRDVASLFGDVRGAAIVSIMLRDEGANEGDEASDAATLRVVASSGLAALDHRPGSRPPRPDGVAWRVLRAAVPRIILRGTDRHTQLADLAPRLGVAASMCVPIPGKPGELPIGVINVARTSPSSVFVPRDLDVCVSIAGLLADALNAIHERATARELRDRMAAVERLSTIGEIAAGIAHEVANPITSVRMNVAELIETMAALAPVLGAIDADEDLEERLDDLPVLLAETWEGLERATDVIRQMKALVRLNAEGALRDERVSLGLVVEDTVRLLGARLGVAVRVRSSNAVFVRGSAVELSQVLVNLAVNAADACEERRVREPGHRSEIAISTFEEEGHGLIEVEDNGSGIAPELLRRIFAPLFTTKPAERGTGLGLAVVRRVVDGHRGSVAVSSTVGRGTTFSIRVPLVDAALASPEQTRGADATGSTLTLAG